MQRGTSVEFLILANHVEAVNGLLFISGGGWTDHFRAVQPGSRAPAVSHLGVGISVLVPWTETNQDHRFTVQIEDDDGTTTIARVEGQLNVGRPVGLPPGEAQHAVVAVSVDTQFPKEGGYQVIATVNDGMGGTACWPFRVHDVRGMPPLSPTLRMGR